jgi:N-acetylglutamate synthase-like GNAT family acetyltransferase
MEAINLHIINTTSHYYPQVYELREEILRKPLGLSLKNENLDRDIIDDTLIAECNGNVWGCLLLHRVDAATLQLRAMAVYEQHQQHGIGSKLIKKAEEVALQKGYTHIILHARKVAMGFYQKLGYTITGDEFTEVGIPHYMMGKTIG